MVLNVHFQVPALKYTRFDLLDQLTKLNCRINIARFANYVPCCSFLKDDNECWDCCSAFRKYSKCWVLQKFEKPCWILKKFVHTCVVNVIHNNNKSESHLRFRIIWVIVLFSEENHKAETRGWWPSVVRNYKRFIQYWSIILEYCYLSTR